MRNGTAPLAALVIVTSSCAEGGTSRIPWPGSVDAEIDNLTGARTGLFRTYGPTQLLTAGRDSIPVTLGYWCQVNEDREPVAAADGLFFKVAMPDTSLVSDDEAAFEELSGQLGLLDVARMAVDGRVYAWQYRPTPTYGGWFLDGEMGFRPNPFVDTEVERDSLLQSFTTGYETLAKPDQGLLDEYRKRRLQETGDRLESELREVWSPAHDYVTSHYVGRDTLGIELKGALKFSLRGFSAAADSVRFWCPVPQSHHEWNAARAGFFGRIDSLRSASTAEVASLQEERERGVANARTALERARAAVQPRETSVSAAEARKAQEEDSVRALGLRTYQVRAGDSLLEIARAYGVTADRLRSFNNLRGSRIYLGQVLRIPPKG